MVERPVVHGLGAATAGLDPWILIPLLVVLVALCALLIVLRRRRSPSQRGASARSRNTIGRLELYKAWMRFERGLPWEARSNLSVFPHFVVVGDAGSGKTRLIDRGVDAQKRARQSYPSYTDDPHINFYMGTHAIVTELSASLLTDNSRAARDALRLLWWRQTGISDPTFVIALNLSSSAPASLDALIDHAQYIRGRIGQLSRSVHKSVTTHLALTFADDPDSYPGFLELAEQLSRDGVELYLDISQRRDLDQLVEELGRYKPYTSKVLVAVSQQIAQDSRDPDPSEAPRPSASDPLLGGEDPADTGVKAFHESVEFFDEHGLSWPPRLATFLKVLDEPDKQLPRPSFGRVYFTSERGPLVGHPFAVRSAQIDDRSLRRSRFHRVMAALFVLVAGGLPVLASLVATRLERDAEEAIEAVFSTPDATTVDRAVQTLRPLAERSPLYALLEVFMPRLAQVPEHHQALREELVTAIRERILLEHLSAAYERNDAHSAIDVVYTLGALYASRDSELGTWIMDEGYEREWTAHLGSRVSIARNYVRMSSTRWDRAPAYLEQDTDLSASTTGEVLQRDQDAWADWLARLREYASLRKTLTQDELRSLQQGAKRLEVGLDEAADSVLANRITSILKTLEFKDPERVYSSQRLDERYPRAFRQDRHSRWLQQNHQSLRVILNEVLGSELLKRQQQSYDLKTFLVVGLPKIDPTSSPIVTIKGTPPEPSITFDIGRWRSLVAVSDASNALAAYKSRFDRTGSVFFSEPNKAPLRFQGYERGSFSVKGSVPWRYSREALEGELVPLLRTLDAKVGSLQLAPEERDQLGKLIEGEVGAYMRAYADVWADFFLSFRIQAMNGGELAGILDKMNLTRSPLYETLEFLAQNTTISGLEDARYREVILRELEPFQPLNALVRGVDASGDVLRAQQVLAHMRADLELAEEQAAKAPAQVEEEGGGSWLSRISKGEAEPPTPAVPSDVVVDVKKQRAAIQALEQELVRLAKNSAGSSTTRLSDYQKIISDLRVQLQPQGFLAGARAPGEEGEGEVTADARFRAQLSPVGNLAMDAIQRGLTPFDQRVEGWLNDVGVAEWLRRPFRALFQSANHLGVQNIESTVAMNWTSAVRVQIADYLTMYPFRGSTVNEHPTTRLGRSRGSGDVRSGESRVQEVGIAQLERVLIPGSGFWKDVDGLVMPALERRGGKLVPRRLLTESRELSLQVPWDMLQTLSHLQRVRDTLWTHNGDRQSLCMDVTPHPLPLARSDGWVATLSYLTLGSSSVFGFNQRAASQLFVLPWWSQQDAVVGVRMASPSGQNDARKPREDLRSIPDSPWALLRLLDMADCALGRTNCTGYLTWRLQVPVTFVIQRDPRLLFDLDTPPGQWPDLACQGEKGGEGDPGGRAVGQ